MTDTALFNPVPYTDDTRMSLLSEQYRLFVEMTDKMSERRSHANNFYFTLNTGLIAGLATIVGARPAGVSALFPGIVLVVSMLLCYVWFRTIMSYQQLNRAKFTIILEIEKQLPARLYGREWEVLGEGQDRKLYWPITRLERLAPMIFGIFYLLVGVALLANWL